MASPKFRAGSTRTDGRIGGGRPWPAAGPPAGRRPGPIRAGAASQSRQPCPPPGRPDTPIWSLQGPELRFKRGDILDVAFGNELPVPARPQLARDRWRPGHRTADGAGRRSPPAARMPCNCRCVMPGPSCATSACSATDRRGRREARALIVQESEPVAVDRDEVLLIEEWRLGPMEPRSRRGPTPATPRRSIRLTARLRSISQPGSNERLRLRFINGCQRAVIAIKLERLEVRVMAIDGQPAEPFQARNGALVLAPGGRVDVFVDVTAPAGTSNSDPPARRQGSPPDRQDRRLERAADPHRPAATGPAAALQRPAGAARPQERPPRRSRARRSPGRLGDTSQVQRHHPARLPRQGRAAPSCWP